MPRRFVPRNDGEAAAVERINALPREARDLLSHVVRNGICNVLSAIRLEGDAEKALFELEARWEALGL